MVCVLEQQEKHYTSSPLNSYFKEVACHTRRLHLFICELLSLPLKVELSIYYHTMKVHQEMGVHVFLTLILDGDPSPTQFTAKEKNAKYCWKGDRVEPTVSLDDLEKRNISCPFWPSILKPLHYTASMFKPFPQVFMVLCLVLLAKFPYGTVWFTSSYLQHTQYCHFI